MSLFWGEELQKRNFQNTLSVQWCEIFHISIFFPKWLGPFKATLNSAELDCTSQLKRSLAIYDFGEGTMRHKVVSIFRIFHSLKYTRIEPPPFIGFIREKPSLFQAKDTIIFFLLNMCPLFRNILKENKLLYFVKQKDLLFGTKNIYI